MHHYVPEYEAEDVILWGKKTPTIIQPEPTGDPARITSDRGSELSQRLPGRRADDEKLPKQDRPTDKCPLRGHAGSI